MPHEVRNREYILTDDPAKVQEQMEALCDLVARQHWGGRREPFITKRSFENSRVFIILHGNELAGCCRVLSDEAILAYFEDVIINERYRRRKLGQWMIQSVMQWPNLKDVHRWLLDTEDMHAFYRSLGYTPVPHGGNYLEQVFPYPAKP